MSGVERAHGRHQRDGPAAERENFTGEGFYVTDYLQGFRASDRLSANRALRRGGGKDQAT
jgi:hypothetical protein